MIFDQIAIQPFTLDGSIQRRRELHKLFYTPKQKRAPEPIVEPREPEITPAIVAEVLDRKLPKAQKAIIFTDENGREWIDCASVGPIEQIKREVIEKHGITMSEFVGPRRHRKFVAARQEYYYRARTETLHPFSYIGFHCGGRDHSTVMVGIERHNELAGLKQ